jgi:putative copper export protein
MTNAATEVAQSSVFERVARAGYVVSGSADQSGALAALSATPGGIIALWAAAIALLIAPVAMVSRRRMPLRKPRARGASCVR